MSAPLTGRLDMFFETGTEGLLWTLNLDPKHISFDGHPYTTFELIESGDRLCIFNEDGDAIFNGVIDPDHCEGWTEYPSNPGHGQPAALGYWIHWTQRGWCVEDWARLFIETHPQAELTKYVHRS